MFPTHLRKCCGFSYAGLSLVDYNRSREIVVAAENKRTHCMWFSSGDIYNRVRTDYSHTREATSRLPASHAGSNSG
jgi:hypothetical protein